MYKTSKFNILLIKENKFCVLNTLTGNLAVVKDKKTSDYLQKREIEENEDEVLSRLLNDGFIIREDDDEDAMAGIKYIDIVANKDLYLVLMPTLGCNFRCGYCYENDPNSEHNFANIFMNENVQNQVIKFAKNKLKEQYGIFIEWYGGEPLLGLDIIENMSLNLIDICQKRGKPYYSTLTTNGYLLTEEVFRRCLKNHIYSFHITVDGFAEIHDKFRSLQNGEGTQAVILNNLRNIRDKVKSQYFKIILRTNISKELIPKLDDWIKFLHEEFGADKRFQFFFRPIENRGGTAVKSVENSIVDDMNKAYDIMIQSKYKLDFGYIKPFMYDSICSAAKRNRFIIDPVGIVKKCGEYLNHPFSIVGKLNEDGKMDLDKNSLARWIKIDSMTQKGKCSDCKSRVSCFNLNCPMRQNILENKCNEYCGVENTYIKKVMDLLTERDYNFIIKY